jgi:acetyl esterase/lipase
MSEDEMQRTWRWVLVAAGIAVGLPPVVVAADKPLVVNLWPGKPPGEKGDVKPEKVQESKPGERPLKLITNVTEPTLTIFKPANDKNTGAAVVIAPGGGYNILAWDLEGTEVAEWLNSIGVTGIVLKYRVPRRPGTPGTEAPPQAETDGQRAISLARSKASEWGIDPKRIGMLGFSAGGHLTAWTSTNFDKRSYEPVDDADKASCRPDFTVLIYPGYLVEKDRLELRPDIRVTKDSPPTFFAHATDDPVTPDSSVAMYLALKKVKVPAELHLYASGGHGFGLRKSNHPCSTWPQRCADWMKAQGLLGSAGK